MRTSPVVGALLIMAALTAGCVGSFEVKQTEPIRIQIDGTSQKGRVAAAESCDNPCSDADTQEFEIETTDVEQVTVVVTVTKVTSSTTRTTTTTTASGNNTAEPRDDAPQDEPCEVLVIVKDASTGAKIQEKTVTVQESSAEATLDIDVKGKNNVVVVTQAVQGVADVDVAAQTSSSSSGDQNMGSDEPSSSSGAPATTSATSTSSPPPTTTASASPTQRP